MSGPAMTLEDLKKIRWSAAGATLALFAGIGLAVQARQHFDQSNKALRTAEARHQEADRKLRQVNDEEVEIKAKSASFNALQQRRAVGPEQRLAWVETLQRIREQRKLFSPEYEFSPQQNLGAPIGSWQFGSSAMKLRLPLLHEGDLATLLTELRRDAPAIVFIDQCKIDRHSASATEYGVSPNLRADCTLNWVTLQQKLTGTAR